MTPCVDSCFFPPGTSKKLPPLKPPGFPAKWTRICLALGTCLGGWRLVSAGSRCCRRCLNKMRGSILQKQIGNHFGNYRFLKAPDWSRHKIMISLKVQESGEKSWIGFQSFILGFTESARFIRSWLTIGNVKFWNDPDVENWHGDNYETYHDLSQYNDIAWYIYNCMIHIYVYINIYAYTYIHTYTHTHTAFRKHHKNHSATPLARLLPTVVQDLAPPMLHWCTVRPVDTRSGLWGDHFPIPPFIWVFSNYLGAENWDGSLFLWCFLVPSGHSSTRNTGEQSEPKPSITICTNKKKWHPTRSAFFMACGQFCLIRWHRFSEIFGFPQIFSTFWVIVVQKEQSAFACDLRQVAGRQVDSQSLRPHVFLNTEIFTSCLASPTVCRNLVVLDSKKYPTAGLRGQRLENPFLRVEKPWRRWFSFERKVGMIIFCLYMKVILQKPERPANHLFFF